MIFFLIIFLRTSSALGGGGVGGGAARRFFLSFFPCSADHERDWPPCKVVSFGLLATNAVNMRNNNNPIRGGLSKRLSGANRTRAPFLQKVVLF